MLQQIQQISVTLTGDGSSTSFTWFDSSIPTNVSIQITPVPLSSLVTDGIGNITITTSSPIPNATMETFIINLFYSSNRSFNPLPVALGGMPLPVQTVPGFTVATTGTVSVSNFPATQPISATSLPLPTSAATDASLTNGNQKTQVTNFPASQPISGTISTTQGTTPWTTQDAADGTSGAASPLKILQVGGSDGANLYPCAATLKGIQGIRAIAVQELKDSGRTYLSLTADTITAPTTEALSIFTYNKGGTSTTGQTEYTVTSGKIFRLQSITAEMQSGSGSQTFKIRLRSAATVAAASPIIWMGTAMGANGVTIPLSANFPDGIEIAAGQQIGVSLLSTNASNSVTYCLNGFEY